MPSPVNRYAVYYAPPVDDPLHAAGVSWLGRDAVRELETSLSGNAMFGGSEMLEFISSARRYGFHATLRPPSPLRDGVDEAMFVSAVADVCSQGVPFEMPRLQVATLNHFVALLPNEDDFDLGVLAGAMLRGLDSLRRPYTDAEIAHRASPMLTAHQRDLLERWGYPHVLDAFHFHITLTRRLASHTLPMLLEIAAQHFEPALASARVVNEVSVFVEREAPSDFVELCRLPLTGGAL